MMHKMKKQVNVSVNGMATVTKNKKIQAEVKVEGSLNNLAVIKCNTYSVITICF